MPRRAPGIRGKYTFMRLPLSCNRPTKEKPILAFKKFDFAFGMV